MISDLHNAEFGKDNEKLISCIEKINPDFILVAGGYNSRKAGTYSRYRYTFPE